ncbi:aspartyl/glutamyl-tRNA(Asn/Gln) amidotransferase subunit A [Pseudopedobacter saltans DSM 12145]|uniref:Glutamyl-tRNA(Gln) amidotransferase subunit A n=1 Tax=Pseudopedobacter saltans (strain ATCC 51119 / DSM 12145 / JCM 21818 / CCUG 39354 / LMG 10337 / NBRC 100064 / NCIMB 13643) TaxID=762903 RepID=F0SBW7_PSESL|nr:Asp-tRNA(Asn)/Glu-tRNA(Gln) amidotransferase subunit GatA [Pseudopedobacter saltans]ADY53808.1 aspartyl/glutamyl-tRNA(Asn/Gln) amidotransferase subunit A [Pseudopedobacter saltans DSM 12145]
MRHPDKNLSGCPLHFYMLAVKTYSYNRLEDIQSAIKAGMLSLQELVAFYLSQIQNLSDLNAFLEVFSEESIQKAEIIQEKIINGTAGKLAGMVIGIKDNISYKGHKISAASKMLENYTAVYSATVVDRLLAEDAIIIGRLNCDEFAMGASNETSYFGPVKNFANRNKVSGGSSGGSAVAVQANMCLASLGTDTGGSIRQPAAFCGVIGIKPTYSRVSRYGVIAYASSFDQVGPITRSVEDAALLLEVLAGRDENDNISSGKAVPEYSRFSKNTPKKIAYIEETLNSEGLDPEIKRNIEGQIEKLKVLGHIVEPVSFKYLDYVVAAYYILTTAESSSNLSRYDGVHFGYRSEKATDLESTYKLSRSEGFGEEVKRRIMLGTFVLSAGYYDAYYARAQKVRRLIKEKMEEILDNYDFVLTPTTPGPAFDIGAKKTDPLEAYLADIFTVIASLTGLPAISVPCGTTEEGLPIGIQFIGKSFEEDKLLSFSKDYLEK